MTKETIKKFLNNRCTEEELNSAVQWFKEDALSAEGKKIGFEDWKAYTEDDSLGNDAKFSLLFDKIQSKINNSNKTTLTIVVNWISKVAAIILLPVLALLFYTLAEKNKESVNYANLIEISAPVGSKAVVNLSDGSVVHLNYGSKIKYPQFFTGETREIELIGEAYFDVAHNPDKPFIVETDKLDIKALGTSFNVLSYPGDDIIETTLVTGKVVLEHKGSDGKTKTVGAMVPGQHVSYNTITGEVISTKEESVEKYIAWKDGKLVFEDTPITQIAERLSRMFNVNIKVSEDAEDNFYTVTFIDEPLFQILDMITIATPEITYKAFPREKLENGTFSKQEIKIMKQK